MSRWQLRPDDGGAAYPLPADGAAVVGRSPECEVCLPDDTVSRHHAELRPGPDGLQLRDLGSSNGIRVNEVRVTRALLRAGDRVRFGSLGFLVEPAPASAPAPLGTAWSEDTPPGTVVRALDLGRPEALAAVQAERLARLVELATALSGASDLAGLLATVVNHAAALLPADRVALLLLDAPGGPLRLAHAASPAGQLGELVVPRSIAQRALTERRPLVTENAQQDARIRSGSVVEARVRAALCVPLLLEQRALGVLYLDSVTRAHAFDPADAALALALAGLAAAALAKEHFAGLARREALARANLERYFAPAVAARIAGSSGARPGGERRTVSILMSDVRNFTRVAEGLAPEAVAAQLSEYFAAMVELVFAHGGTLDKFIGDALLAFWGAPLAVPDPADRALAAARAMQAETATLNQRWESEGRPTLGVGIGLHYGEVFAGTIGSPRRLEYTVIGDAVNVAARLCKAAAAGEILVGAAAAAALSVPLPPGARETLALRGREEGAAVYRVGGDR